MCRRMILRASAAPRRQRNFSIPSARQTQGATYFRKPHGPPAVLNGLEAVSKFADQIHRWIRMPFPPRKAAPSECAPQIFYKEAFLPIAENHVRALIRNTYRGAGTGPADIRSDQENVSVPKIRIAGIPDRGYHVVEDQRIGQSGLIDVRRRPLGRYAGSRLLYLCDILLYVERSCAEAHHSGWIQDRMRPYERDVAYRLRPSP